MTEHDDIAERFARDTKEHEMAVRHNDGLYRHLHFAKPGTRSWSYWFDIVTWPGVLHIRGDMGDSYTFTRLPDMFVFFRNPGGRINAHYWSEKLDGGRDSAKVYSEDKVRRMVVEDFVEAARNGGVPPGTGKAVRTEILDADLSDEAEARAVLEQFEHGPAWHTRCSCGANVDVKDGTHEVLWRNQHLREAGDAHGEHRFSTVDAFQFRFRDVWEWDMCDYDWSFLWACHAIVWGIAQYDAAAAEAARAENGGEGRG